MHNVSCPSCGASVTFRSTASVMAVCDYCKSTLLKEADTVKDIGKMSDVLEDYSPIQINTTGVYWNKSFTVIGRIQLRYDGGFWNEWYILFDDGDSGWLSDASGQFVITQRKEDTGVLPEFSSVRVGDTYNLRRSLYAATDKRTAQCISGQGELPFTVGKGWEAKVIDFRSGQRFATIDYSFSGPPIFYSGHSVYLHELSCQLLRSADEITITTGKFRGKTIGFDCPNCGSSIQYQTAMALHVICTSCHAEINCSEDTAVVLRKHNELGQIYTTLQLGDIGTFNQVKYSIIGFMKCREIDSDEFSEWTEYLLFNPTRGFLWLIESNGKWDQVQVLNDWPIYPISDSVAFRNKSYKKLYQYGSQVSYAAGAFNWRVVIGDKTLITDFGTETEKLTLEQSSNEITWSLSKRLSAESLAESFGKSSKDIPSSTDGSEDKDFIKKSAKIFSAIFLMINIPIAFFSGSEGVFLIIIAVALFWVPLFSDKDMEDD